MLNRFNKFAAAAGLCMLGLSLGGFSSPAAGQNKPNPEIIPLIAVDSYATTALWTHVFLSLIHI